jgi:hypothetical protein
MAFGEVSKGEVKGSIKQHRTCGPVAVRPFFSPAISINFESDLYARLTVLSIAPQAAEKSRITPFDGPCDP